VIFRLVFGLIGVNLLGVDPADALIVTVAALIFLYSPFSYMFQNIIFPARFFMFLFLCFFALSSYNGYDLRFIVSISINFFIFILIYFCSIESKNNYDVGSYIVKPYVILNVFFFVTGSLSLDIWENTFEIFRNGRFMGSMGDPNFTGFFAIFCIIFLVDRLVFASQRTRSDVLLLLLATAILILTESRAAWGGALVGGMLYFALIKGKRYQFLIPTAFAALIVIASLSFSAATDVGQFGNVAERARSVLVQSDNAEVERFEFVYTRAALRVGFDNPLGIGSGMTAAYTGLVSQDGLPIGSHNAFVQVFTELGWPAFICLVALLIGAISKLWRRAADGWMLNDVSCRVILSMVAAQIVFAMAHDMIAWRIAWVVPSLAICAAFARASDQEVSNYEIKKMGRPDRVTEQRLTGEPVAL